MKIINRKTIFVVSAILFFAVLIYTLNFFSLLDVNKIQSIVESSGIYAPIVFGVLYIGVTLTGVSAAFFTVLAGTLFGAVNGLIIVVLSATIAAAISFYIARFFRSKFLESKKSKKNKNILSNLIKKIEMNAKKNGFVTISILRLSFLPYIPLSYASGLVKNLKFSDFILATLITNVFGSFVFIFLGDRIKELLQGNFDIQTIITLLISIALLICFIVFVPKIAKRFQK